MSVNRSAVNIAAFIGCSIAAEAIGQSIPLSPTAQASGAVITHDQGIEFVTIGSPGNAGWPGLGVPGRVDGRGAVGYEYRIGRQEVSTAQWVEFFNAAFDRPQSDGIPFLVSPSRWGAVGTAPNNPGGRRWTVPAGNDLQPVGDVTWRVAAMYCNWLSNDKRTDRAAFLSGAYEVSTFGYDENGFTDQLVHTPGARFWIPTWDEWLKAAHYDPNKNGPDHGAYWTFPITSDTLPAYGPPGLHVRTSGFPGPDPNGPLAQVNGSWDNLLFPGFDPFHINLGAYPTVQSPWGLLDVAGGSSEWTEETLFLNDDPRFPDSRVFEGSTRGLPGAGLDQLRAFGAEVPSMSTFEFGFRIAGAVPSPGASCVLLLGGLASLRRRRIGENHEDVAVVRRC